VHNYVAPAPTTQAIIPNINTLIVPCPQCKVHLQTYAPYFRCPCGQLILLRY
jgi:hypothetical protein